MGQLRISAIDARFQGGLVGLMLGIARFARWELTCGFCKSRIVKVQPLVWSSAQCPACGSRNLLPVPRFPSDPGPRPPNWPDYSPPSG